jgi:error-prone DNA polymerase
VREVAKVYGMEASKIKEVTRRLSGFTNPSRIPMRIASHPKFKGFPLDPPWPEILQLAARLESLPRHLSVHCGGVVLVPDRVSRYVPVQGSRKGVNIIQWEKDQAEAAGLVKIDLLGNRSLAVIRDAIAAVEKNTGKHIDYASLSPVDDPEAIELLRSGDTLGVFYVESPAVRQLQRKSGKGDFDHLVIHSSIIRPAANRYIHLYLRRLHGEPYEPLHPVLGDLLSETYGILVYQEDVVKVAIALGGFNWAEADRLRKLISRKSPEELSLFKDRFLSGCGERGVAPDTAREIWGMFLSFSGYSFCKPHSASYSLVSFKSAYLKAHHPAEFMAAVISNGGGYYSTFAYVSEARRMGITVLGPDVNESELCYTGKGRAIRVGMQQLRDIRRETIKSILEERGRNGPFTTLWDFLGRVGFAPSDGGQLVKSGLLDSLAAGFNRPQLLWAIEAWVNRRALTTQKGARGQVNALLPTSRAIDPPSLTDLAPEQKWRQEKESLGFTLSVHPLKEWEHLISRLPFRILAAKDIPQYEGKRVWLIGWPVTRKEVLTKKGEAMEFVTFEDETSLFETVFFPDAFRRFCQSLDMGRPYALFGTVESDFGELNLNVQRLIRLGDNGR